MIADDHDHEDDGRQGNIQYRPTPKALRAHGTLPSRTNTATLRYAALRAEFPEANETELDTFSLSMTSSGNSAVVRAMPI